MLRRNVILTLALAFSISACSIAGGNRSLPLSNNDTPSLQRSSTTATSLLREFTTQIVIGSTVDPLNDDKTPYGLAIAQETAGKVNFGTLFACNFNNAKNVRGAGTTVVSLAPTAGAKPVRFAQNSNLLGCSGLDFGTSDTLFASAYGNGSVTEVSSKGKVGAVFKGGNYVRPFALGAGQIGYPYSNYYVFASDVSKGTVILVRSCQSGCQVFSTAFISGFPVRKGKSGNILGPSALAFDQFECGPHNSCGTLYVVDGANNAIYSFEDAGNMRTTNDVIIGSNGKTFTGPFAQYAHILYQGKPLNGPIGGAVIYPAKKHAGNLVVANTLDPKGQNLLIEISPSGKVLDTLNVDKGAGGALFGIAGNSIGSSTTTQLFFTDDNASNVRVLEK